MERSFYVSQFHFLSSCVRIGSIIEWNSDTDYMLQIPLETLAQTRHVIGICSSNTKPEALLGALRSGVINHLIAPESIVKAAVNFQKQF